MDTVTQTDLIVRFFLAVDDRDWDRVRASLSDNVVLDYSSLSGGDAERLAAEDLVGRWQSLLPGFDATQHFVAPVVLTGDADTASAECNVRAYHRLVTAGTDGDVWIVAGRYTIELARSDRGWLIHGITLRLTYQEGNLHLADLASTRVLVGGARA